MSPCVPMSPCHRGQGSTDAHHSRVPLLRPSRLFHLGTDMSLLLFVGLTVLFLIEKATAPDQTSTLRPSLLPQTPPGQRMSALSSTPHKLKNTAVDESDQHPCGFALTGGSIVYQMDTTNERYQQLSDSFFQNWSKANATGIQIEAVWKVVPNRLLRDRYELYKRTVSESLDPLTLNEKTLFHGTNSCLAMRISNQRMDVLNSLSLDEKLVCQEDSCATCGIATAGFDIARSGNGSILRGQHKVWQRFGHGIYFSKHSSKCHFYSKTGETALNPYTKRRYSTMVVSDVVLGNAFTAQGSAVEQTWVQAPAGYHSVQGLPGYGGIKYEENVVFTPDACLPSEIVVYSFSHTTEY